MKYSAESIKNDLVKSGYDAYVTSSFDFSINRNKSFQTCFIRSDKTDLNMWQIAEDRNARIEVACLISPDKGKWIEFKVMPKDLKDLEFTDD